MSDWTRMTNPAAIGEPTHIASYERPEWAFRMQMPCGHVAADYGYDGRCMRCSCERYISGLAIGKGVA